jgi:hypothetical protein
MSGSAGPTARHINVGDIGGCITRGRPTEVASPLLLRLGSTLIAEFADPGPAAGGRWAWSAGRGSDPPPRVLIVHFTSAGNLDHAEIVAVLDSTVGWDGHRPVGVVGTDPALPGLVAPRRGLHLFATIAEAVLGLRSPEWVRCPPAPAWPRHPRFGPNSGRVR